MKPFNPKNKIHFQVKQFTFFTKNLKKKTKKKWLIIKKFNKGLFKSNKFINFNQFNKFTNSNQSDKFINSFSFNKLDRSKKFIKFIKFISNKKNINKKEYNIFIKYIKSNKNSKLNKFKNFKKIKKLIKIKSINLLNSKTKTIKLIKFNKTGNKYFKFIKIKFNKNIYFNKFKKIKIYNNKFYKKKNYKIYYYKNYLYKIFFLLKKKNIFSKLHLKNINLKNIILYLYLKKKIKNFIKFLIKQKYYKNKNKFFIQKKKKLKKKKLKKFSIKLLYFLKNNKNFFKITLNLKQLIKNFNGKITTKKFKKIFKIFFFIKNKYNINFCIFLDSSIDNYLIKTGLARSIYEARQLIVHNKVIINNTPINSCFIFLKPGDIFNLKNKNIPIKQKLPINIIYNKFLKNFIFMRYKNINEIYYPFNIDTHLLEYSLKKK